jgi:hypothetical protein
MRKPLKSDSARAAAAKAQAPVMADTKTIPPVDSAKHELLAEAIVIHGEAAGNLAALSARFHAEFHPRTQIETHHVETMIMCRWRLHRVWEFEAACLNHEIEKLSAAVDEQKQRARGAMAFKNLADQSRSLDVLNRYETKFFRAFIRAHQALMELKSKPVPDWSDHQEQSILITINTRVIDAPAIEPAPEKNNILPNEPDPDPTPVL